MNCAGRWRNVDRVDVLPFHRLGAPKYERLGLPFALADTPPPTAATVATVRRQFDTATEAIVT